MALELPESANEIVQRAKTDVQRNVPGSNAFLKNSWLGALITGYANRIYDFYLQLREVQKQSFPNTATLSDLENWASIWFINRLAATQATGNVVATGTATTSIPIGTIYKTSDGKLYASTATVIIAAANITISSITRVGDVATVTTIGGHSLASNVLITITGADQSEYNVTNEQIVVIGLNKFTFPVTGSPATPATGTTILASHTSIPVPLASNDFGINTNQDAGAELELQSPIVGVDNAANVDYGALGGGSDQETDVELQLRLVTRIQNPVAHFNAAEIDAKAKEIAGVTRVFIDEATPAEGQVTIYFTRDNDPNPIPTGSEVTVVKNKILEIKPANTADADVIVNAPTGITVNFTFSALSPDTSTMRAAIEANLRQFFDERTSVGVDIDEDAYRSAVFNTVDTTTGDVVSSFTLTVPSGDIVMSSGQIGVLGGVIFP
jgi:uncharacterized phage protein gp47/JayE